MNTAILEKISYIYGEHAQPKIAEKLENLLSIWARQIPESVREHQPALSLTEKDAIIITYGDSVRTKDAPPLQTLKKFAGKKLKDIASSIHILPFSPYSSDDGFSVIDYRKINPELGTWDDMSALSRDFNLMADLVLNHCSAESNWFKAFLNGDEKYKDFFITVDKDTDLSKVFRPRALPLLHPFETSEGEKWVWTTFSRDQVDLNFANPEVFLEFTDILLFYISKGIKIIRLDAIGFLWKEIGTTCMHHPKTHAMVQLFRAVLAEIAPQAILLTETNVPHKENISYFGNGRNEAQMVYQFSLPPLTMDAMIRGDAGHLTHWASTLEKPDPHHTFFNFLASHDGVGVLPAHGYLTENELANLAETVLTRGGRISYKSTPKGDIPYELNINYCDAVAERDLPTLVRARKFLTSQAIMLSMAGVPGIYIHSILGSGNWEDGVKETGANRTINREKLDFRILEVELNDSASFRAAVYNGYSRLLKTRREEASFHPASGQKIIDLDNRLFALLRGNDNQVLCLHNVSGETIPLQYEKLEQEYAENLLDPDAAAPKIIQPYETLWLKSENT